MAAFSYCMYRKAHDVHLGGGGGLAFHKEEFYAALCLNL